MSKKIRVAICDDHPLVADGLAQLINGQPGMEVCGTSHRALELLHHWPHWKADVLLLDLHLPDGDGLQVCRQLVALDTNARIIGFSAEQEVAVISRFLKNGARGYLLKTAHSDEILQAIETVHNGSQFLGREVAEAVLKHFTGEKSSTGQPKLSMREREVLRLIANELTTQEIAEKLHLSVNTIETHRNHLLQKLGARNLAGLVRIAIERGLV